MARLTRTDLFPYQERLAKFAVDKQFWAGWVDMGLGKTVSALTAYIDLLNQFKICRILVVAPKRVARKVWSDEIARWGHLQGLTVSKIMGTPQQRWDALNAEADVYLTNREQLEWIAAQFFEGDLRTGAVKRIRKWRWPMMILDESQSFKSESSTRWKVMRNLRRLPELERIGQLTGTPAPNGYKDLWAQLFLLDKGERLGWNFKAFEDRWLDCDTTGEYPVYVLKDTAAKEIQGLVSDIVLTLRAEDYLTMPPVVYNQIRVELPGKALATYKKLKREFLAEVNGKSISAVNSGVVCGKLLQLANGAVYHDAHGGWVRLHDEKVDALLETLEAAPGPVMIAYGFKHDLARCKDALNRFCGAEKTWRVLETEQDEDDWNAGKIDYLLLHPASAGHGLNLQHSGSETIVWFGLTANLEWYQQLNARLIGGHRGQDKNVVIHHLVAEDTYDVQLMQLLLLKATTQDDLTRSLVQLAAGRS